MSLSGTPTGSWASFKSAVVPLESVGMHVGRTYTLGFEERSDKTIGCSVMLYDGSGSKIVEYTTPTEFTVHANAAKLSTYVYVQNSAGKQIDARLHPMLVEGMPAEYVPYALGGQVLDNLWRWNGNTSAEFKLLDDGGLSVDYDGVDPASKWNNAMWRGTLADADMRVGETYFLAEFGGATAANLNVRFLDADMAITPEQSSAFEKAFAVPDGAAYVEMYVSLNGKQEPQRFTSYPMLARGSARPAGFVPPNKAGGGLAELWPEYAVQTVNGIAIEPAEGGYRVHGTATAPANIWVKANLEAGAAYLASLSSTSPDVTAQVYRSGQTVTVRDGAPQRFEAVGGEYYLYVKVDAGKTVDAIARPSLIRIGDAGGGIANLVGRAPVTVHKAADSDVVEVGEGGVRYSVENDYLGTFAVLDLEPGAYRVNAGDNTGFIISTVQVDGFYLNDYYSRKVGAETYASRATSLTLVLPEPGKLGFSLPHGEGVIHPSIVRIL